MEWVSLIVASVMLVLIASPVLFLVVTFFVLVPLALLAPAVSALGRTSFTCPVTRRHVTATFLTKAGKETPSDVVACSMFPDGVRCAKSCLCEAHTSWTPSPAVARYALLSGGEALRDA